MNRTLHTEFQALCEILPQDLALALIEAESESDEALLDALYGPHPAVPESARRAFSSFELALLNWTEDSAKADAWEDSMRASTV